MISAANQSDPYASVNPSQGTGLLVMQMTCWSKKRLQNQGAVTMPKGESVYSMNSELREEY